MRNRYPGVCTVCDGKCGPGEGVIKRWNDQCWVVHLSCEDGFRGMIDVLVGQKSLPFDKETKMSKFRFGDMWQEFGKPATIVLVTTNSVITRNGLVMGKGSALEAAKRFPGIRMSLAKKLKELGFQSGTFPTKIWYGVLVSKNNQIGIFQTKFDWRSPSGLDIVRFSCKMLREIALKHPDMTYHLPFPGVGNGGLPEELVLPILMTLPDNVFVWRYNKKGD